MKKRLKKIIVILFIFFIGTNFTFAEETIAPVEITASSSTIGIGETTQVTIRQVASEDANEVCYSIPSYSSSDDTIATVDSSGKVTGLKAGTVTITGSLCNMQKGIEITVNDSSHTIASYSLNPSSATISVGESIALEIDIGPGDRVNCYRVDGNFSSSDPSVATVDDSGKVTGLKAGSTTITYSPCDIIQATSTITVTENKVAPVEITASSSAIGIGGISQVTIRQVASEDANEVCYSIPSYSSSDDTIATVDSSGKVTGLKAGTVTITGSLCNMQKGIEITIYDSSHTIASYSLNPSSATISVGESIALAIDIGPGDRVNCYRVDGNFSSSDPSVATVDTNGKVTGLKAGSTTITYSPCDIIKATSTITVTELTNPKTGTIAFYVSIIITIISLGISFWSFKKLYLINKKNH